MSHNCGVCGQISWFRYYGARSCESCKQFFRRSVMGQKAYECSFEGSCKVRTELRRCFCCRMDKCLLQGMQPQLIGKVCANLDPAMLEYLDRLKQRRRQLEADGHYRDEIVSKEEMSSKGSNTATLDLLIFEKPHSEHSGKLLEFLTSLNRRLWRVWESLTQLPANYLDDIGDLEKLIQGKRNILTLADELMVPQTTWNRAEFVQNAELSFAFPELVNYICVDMLLVVDVAKALPFFGRLANADKVALLKGFTPASILLNAFYSASIGAGTWTRRNGCMLDLIYATRRFRWDKNIEHFKKRFFKDSVAAVARLHLDREEFMLLLVLLYCNSTASDLSMKARELLYEESTKYGAMLMRFLQQRMGAAQGAKKYAECTYLLASLSFFAEVHTMLLTYLDIFHFNGAPTQGKVLPKALDSIHSAG